MKMYPGLVLLSVILFISRTCESHGDHDGFDPDAAPENFLNKEGFVSDREHIKEHLQGTANFDLSNASREELEFHFFKVHDTSSDRLLDGLELLSALSHSVDHHIANMQKENKPMDPEKIRRLYEGVTRSVDKILEEEDDNNDGYLSYAEYASNRRTTLRLQHAAMKNSF